MLDTFLIKLLLAYLLSRWYLQLRGTSLELEQVETVPEILEQTLEISTNITKDRLLWVSNQDKRNATTPCSIQLAFGLPSTSANMTTPRRRTSAKR